MRFGDYAVTANQVDDLIQLSVAGPSEYANAIILQPLCNTLGDIGYTYHKNVRTIALAGSLHPAHDRMCRQREVLVRKGSHYLN